MTKFNLKEVIDERQDRYGPIETLADLEEKLIWVCQGRSGTPSNWDNMAPYQRVCLRMCMHKVARILNGDPEYIDNWDDASGYMLRAATTMREKSEVKLPEFKREE